VVPRAPHEDLLGEPYPIADMATPEPIWKWWQKLQQEFALPVGDTSFPSSSRAGNYSPHYRSTTPPSASPAPDPVTPIAQTGPSAVGSASFDIRSLRSSARKDPPVPRNVSAIAASPSPSSDMQVDPFETSPADALAIAEALGEALDDPSPRVRA
jgi:hypothetical protein